MMEGVASEASSLAGHLQLGKLDLLLRRQPHHDRRQHVALVRQRRRLRSDSTRTAGTRKAWRTATISTRSIAAIIAAKADPRPSLIRVRTPHRLRRAAQTGHRRGARRAARRRRGPLSQEVLRLARRRAVLGARRSARAHPPRDRARRRARIEWRAALRRVSEHAARCLRSSSSTSERKDSRRRLGRHASHLQTGRRALATRDASQQGDQRDRAHRAGAHRRCRRSRDVDRDDRQRRRRLRADRLRRTQSSISASASTRWGRRSTGMALHGGLRPYGATFLIFSDYMRPTIRLAACMARIPSTSGRTTASASARTVRRTNRSSSSRRCAPCPNMTIMRPADANETAICWRLADRASGRSRRDWRSRARSCRSRRPTSVARRGARRLHARTRERRRSATSSSSAPARRCMSVWPRAICSQKQTASRRASSASRAGRSSTRKSSAYRDDGPPARCARARRRRSGIAPSAGSATSAIGAHVIGMHRFGASAPAEVLFKEFGFTPEHVVGANATKSLALSRLK